MPLIAILIPLVLKILEMFVNSKKASEDQRKAYLDFIQAWEKSPMTSANIRNDFRGHLKEISEEKPTVKEPNQ